MNNTWTTEGPGLARQYTSHSDTLRGLLRHHLVDRALAVHLPEAPQRILDVGGGTGTQARMLARRGHHVTLLDPDEEMLARATTAWQHLAARTPGSIDVVRGAGEQAAEIAGTGWDVVLCHGVLMYPEDPTALLHALARCVRPGGYVSVLAKQAGSLAMRRGLARDWSGVLETLRSPVEYGRLGAVSRGVGRADVIAHLADDHVQLVEWYGVRVFTDHLGDEPPGEDFEAALEAEWEAGRTDPYRGIARLFHLIARAEPTTVPER